MDVVRGEILVLMVVGEARNEELGNKLTLQNALREHESVKNTGLTKGNSLTLEVLAKVYHTLALKQTGVK